MRHTLFPEIEPYRTSTLKVSELHTIFYEEVGNPEGIPAVYLHGGPGVGILPSYRRFFDPAAYRLVLLDQRGAGRSTPHAELRENTTWDLVEDLETLRKDLGIERWMAFGGSWGSTLALCYAITHPSRVSGLVLRGVYLGRRLEHDWVHQPGGMSYLFPDEWERYVAPLPPEGLDDTCAAYYRLLTEGDDETMLATAAAWTRYLAATMTLLPDPGAVAEMAADGRALSIARTECHYMMHGCFLETENQILEQAQRIRHVPCRIVQGRYDAICPMVSAWDLHRALPDSELVIVPDGGHSPMDEGMCRELVRATEDFKSLAC